ncbi:DNA-binding transcriptional regulator, ArsR family [Microlunatus flavus]|uniref:DNA-binding transcriptional regulator, ArsR family n=1 Tax=Microlunatus flavus TaxID=1036181 RepID=A0A1H9M2J4_9ACTN|nr:DNA-binding transcriptional regulator, ArsR family [Microlunatus flavus]
MQTLTEAKALSAMAHPLRTRLLDVLAVDGPSTASVLATRTDQAVGNVSHHLKVLAAARLVEEAPELARDRRERWWRLAAPSTRWSSAELVDDPAAVDAALAAERLALTRQHERARAWLDEGRPDDPWADAAFALQRWLRLTPDELRQVSAELIAVVDRWAARGSDEDPARQPVLVFARGFPTQP